MDQTWTALPVPHAIEVPDRAPKARYVDPDFFALEAEQLWPRVWQMACRLEEIPEPGDVVEYVILDQSVMVLRTDDGAVRAYQNACRHRGVKLVEGRGTVASGFVCPFHGWCYGQDGANTHVPQRRTFAEHNLQAGDIDLAPVRCETWGGCAWINLDDDAPPLRQCIEPIATALDAWKVESLRTEWWYAARLPVNWKLAQQAFQEQYHVVEAHPQLVIPGMRYGAPDGKDDPRSFIDAEIRYLHTMSEGMAGMVHANDVRVAEGLRDVELPDDREEAMATWYRLLNAAVVDWHRDQGSDVPDLNDLEDRGLERADGLLLPPLVRAPHVQQRLLLPLPPAGSGGDAHGDLVAHPLPGGRRAGRPPTPPEVWEHDDPRWPPIPAQDFSNLPKQQQGLHTRGFEYMRLSEKGEGHLSNFERTLDGFLAGLSHEQLAPALREVNVNPLERPIVDIAF